VTQTHGQVLDGKALAADLRAALHREIEALDYAPQLAVVLVGDDPASEVYVRNKVRTAGDIGIRSLFVRLPSNVPQAELESQLTALNTDPDIDGILLQLPLPDGLDSDAAIEKIDPAKDVDGLTVSSTGQLALGRAGLRPCTPYGSVMLAKKALGDNLSGLNVVVVGRSILVGKPAAQLFLAENCTVTIAHSRTQDLPALCRTADILVAAVGRPEMIKGDWVKPGATVIDVGINRVDNPAGSERPTRLVGDVDFASAAVQAAHITPVPGGVGPMTIACLMRNTVEAARMRRG